MTTNSAGSRPVVEPLVETRQFTASTIFGAMWSTSSRLSGRILDFAVLLFLARTLSPADFGLTALAVSVVTLTETLMEVPLVQALTSLKAVERPHLDTAFTIGLLRSMTIYCVLALISWPLALFYGDPRLTGLVLVLALAPAARGMISPQLVGYIRAMRFRMIFVTEVTGKITAAALTVTVAFSGGGYWAIATNSVAASITSALVSYVIAPYLPRFSLAKWRDFLDFLGWMTLSQIISSLNWQIDRIILGRFVPPTSLGQYAMAGDIAVLPTQTLIGPAMSPLMAAFRHIGDDRQRMQSAYLKASRFAMMIAVPAFVGIALLSDLIAAVLLGEKWTLAPDYLRWIALTLTFSAYFQPVGAVAFISRRTDIVFSINLVDFALRAVLVSTLVYFFLVPGALVGRAILAVVVFALTLYFARKLTGAGILLQLRNLAEVAVACAGMAAVVFVAHQAIDPQTLPAIVKLGLLSACGALVYFAILHLLGIRLRSLLPNSA